MTIRGTMKRRTLCCLYPPFAHEVVIGVPISWLGTRRGVDQKEQHGVSYAMPSWHILVRIFDAFAIG